jgi:photosystem II stability/assembly factor-like uncharacterized protein
MNGLYRYDMRIKKSHTIRPIAPVEDPPYRFNWNSPIHISPHDSKIVYTGGNYLFKTTNGGHSWEIISPDLSTNDPEKQKDSGGPITQDNTGAEIHCTIITIAESPVKRGVIWCGTDDGNVQVTTDGGQTWQNVVKNIKGLPANTWCSRIEASHFDEGSAFAAFDGHRHDDYNTYLYKTDDFGKTWASLKGNLPFGWIHVIREDLVNRNLLYVGTEFGLYASLDRGKTWFSLQNNLPTVAVRDIAVHPEENDLIIGTHGRGIWILDDTQPLQEMNSKVFASDSHLFGIRSASAYQISSSSEPSSRPAYSGKNPDFGLILTAYMKNKPKEKPKIIIKSEEGEQVHEISLPTRKGILRHAWNLQVVPKTKDGKVIKPTGVGLIALPVVFPGDYSVEMTADGKTQTQAAMIRPDPRYSIGRAEHQALLDFQVSVIAVSKSYSMSVTAAAKIRAELRKVDNSLLDKSDIPEGVTKSVKDFKGKFQILADKIMPKGIGYKVPSKVALRGGYLSQQLMFLGMWASSYPAAPTEAMLAATKESTDEVNALISQLNEFILVEIPALNKVLEANDLKPIKAPDEVKL